MQAYSDNQADVNGNGFHLLLYISYLVIKRVEEEREGGREVEVADGGGGSPSTSVACGPPPSAVTLSPLSPFSHPPLFTSSLTHPPLLILPVPTRIGSM